MKKILALFVAILGLFGCTTNSNNNKLNLSAKDLFNSFKANKIYLSEDSLTISLDTENLTGNFVGEVITDVIDLLDSNNTLISNANLISSLSIKTEASVPTNSNIKLFVTYGNTFFTFDSWSSWKELKSLTSNVNNINSRYIKLKYILSTTDKNTVPNISSISLTAQLTPLQKFQNDIVIKKFQNEKIITSPVEYGYETKDNPTISEFVKKINIADSIKDIKSEFEKFFYINNWIAKTKIGDHGKWKTNYPWDINELYHYDKEGKPYIEGHCQSYSSVFVTILTGLGYYARQWSVDGFRNYCHEVAEVWSNEHKKWIYFDPSLDEYYADPKTDEPLSILEMHDIYIHTFYKDGETLLMPLDEQKERIKSVGGELRGKIAPIKNVRKEGYAYGEKKYWDWGWKHGYLAAGFMRLATRNNFHSQKEPWFSHFGEGLTRFNVFLSWVDKKTPPYSKTLTKFSRRKRDFYWSLNQASIKAKRIDETTIELEFGQSQPFFDHFLIEVNGAESVKSANIYKLTVKGGSNNVKVTPVDKWGVKGISSSLEI